MTCELIRDTRPRNQSWIKYGDKPVAVRGILKQCDVYFFSSSERVLKGPDLLKWHTRVAKMEYFLFSHDPKEMTEVLFTNLM